MLGFGAFFAVGELIVDPSGIDDGAFARLEGAQHDDFGVRVLLSGVGQGVAGVFQAGKFDLVLIPGELGDLRLANLAGSRRCRARRGRWRRVGFAVVGGVRRIWRPAGIRFPSNT